MVAQKLELRRGREMCSTWIALAGFTRQRDEPLRRRSARGLVAPHRMRARDRPRCADSCGRSAGIRPRHETPHGAGCTWKDPPQAVVVLDHERAGRRADEHLDARRSPARAPVPAGPAHCRGCRRRRRRDRNTCGDGAAFTLAVKVASVTVSGSVLGISNTAVTPPITALRLNRFPDPPYASIRARGNELACPSRRAGCARPVQSITSPAALCASEPIAAMRPLGCRYRARPRRPD